MEDRFKIRVWDKRKNIYIKDFVFNFINKPPYITVEYFDTEYEYTHTFDEDEIIIEQCTGYRDCNGTPIFVGDICSIKGRYKDDRESEWQGTEWIDVDTIEMVYSLESFFGESMIKGIYTALNCDTLEVEVIGNVHENPELVEG